MGERRPSRGSEEREPALATSLPAPATSLPAPTTSVPVQASVPARSASASPLRRAAASAEPAPYVMLLDDPTALFASVEDCLITVVHTLTADAVVALGKAMQQLAQRHGAFRSLAIPARKTGSEAVDENRAAVAQLVQQHTRSIRAAAVVSDGTGFRATSVRSMITSIHMAARATHPAKFFDAVPPAAAWLVSMRPDLPIEAARLERAVESLRALSRARIEKM